MLDYHIDAANNVVVTRVIGQASVTELANHILRLMRDPAFKPELNAMILVTDPRMVPGPVVVGTLTPLVRAWSKRRAGVKWAFVLPNRVTRDFVEAAIADARIHTVATRCFMSESAAHAWLVANTPPAEKPAAAPTPAVCARVLP